MSQVIKILKMPVMDDDTIEIFYRTFIAKNYENICIGKTEGKGMPLIVVTNSEVLATRIKLFKNAMGAVEINEIPQWEPYHISGNEDLWPTL